jgi:hypothetical protein
MLTFKQYLKEKKYDKDWWYNKSIKRAAKNAEAHENAEQKMKRVLKAEKKKDLKESAAPGEETWIKHRKAEFKKKYGDRWEKVLYGAAWNRSKKD